MDAASQKDKYTYMSVCEKLKKVEHKQERLGDPPFIYLQKRNVFKTSDPNLGQSDVVLDDVTYLSIHSKIHLVKLRFTVESWYSKYLNSINPFVSVTWTESWYDNSRVESDSPSLETCLNLVV